MGISKILPDGLRVAVLYGGPGVEREVSLESGTAVAAALEASGVHVQRMDVTGEAAQIAALSCDIAFLVLHGEFGEDGQIQALLEAQGVAFTGSSAEACRLAMDKDASKALFVKHGIPTAPWATGVSADGLASAMRDAGVGFPCVVKPVSRGSSVGVTIVRVEEGFAAAVEAALAVDERVMAEAFIDGPEVTAGLLDGEVLPLIELRPAREFYDYTAKYEDSGTEYLCPAPLPQEVADAVCRDAREVARCLDVRGFARVDFMLGTQGPLVLEVNMIPGFTSHSLLPMAAREAGMAFDALCLRILELGWQQRKK